MWGVVDGRVRELGRAGGWAHETGRFGAPNSKPSL